MGLFKRKEYRTIPDAPILPVQQPIYSQQPIPQMQTIPQQQYYQQPIQPIQQPIQQPMQPVQQIPQQETDEYSIEVICNNCGTIQKINIKKGRVVEKDIGRYICKNCECATLVKKESEKKYY